MGPVALIVLQGTRSPDSQDEERRAVSLSPGLPAGQRLPAGLG